MVNFMDKYFSKFQCFFRKGYRTQKSLIALIEKLKSAVVSLPHELLLAKLNGYGFSLFTSRLIRS